MISKRPSRKKKAGKARPAQNNSTWHSVGRVPNLELLLNYHEHIEQLESTLSGFQDHVGGLTVMIGKLKDARSHFVSLFEHLPAAYLIHDVSGYIHEMNPAAETLLGVKLNQGFKTCFVRFLSDRNLVIWLDHIRRCASTRLSTASELRIRGSGRKERDVQILTSPSSESHSHQDCSFYTLIIDHHHRRAEEVALAQALKEHHRLINMIEGIVWEADETCTFTFVSRYAERLLGFPVKEWMRPGFWENRIFVQDRERVLHELGQAVANRKEVRIDYRVVAADRRLVWLHDCVTVIERNGRRQLLGVAIDVTEQRNAEGLLRQAHDSLEQRVAERTTELGNTVADLEAFSYSLSHDLRAPIRAMQGYAFLLKRLLGKTAPPQVGEFLQRIMRAAERLDLLVQDALNYNRLSRGPLELKPVSLEPLVDNILHDFPTLAPAKAKIDILKPLPVVYGHEAFVGQALSNLFTNAVKFVPHGRTPHVRVWAEAARGNAAGDGSWVRICVEDNGLGIAAEDQKRIFRMFERVYAQEQYEGTGIGLAIVQKAAERMGGCVGVHSTPGAGSKFWLELRQA